MCVDGNNLLLLYIISSAVSLSQRSRNKKKRTTLRRALKTATIQQSFPYAHVTAGVGANYLELWISLGVENQRCSVKTQEPGAVHLAKQKRGGGGGFAIRAKAGGGG